MDLVVVALGGNALASPRGDGTFDEERRRLRKLASELASLAREQRLLIVHGNGTQVGRLLASEVGDASALDVHVAQTQGELGYLIAAALDDALDGDRCVALMTRVTVDPTDAAFATPSKPVGPILDAPPPDAACIEWPGGGWRRVVASPRPLALVEADAIAGLLERYHVVAGGGGGVAVDRDGRPVAAVVDKDWTASMLAVQLEARRLIYVTDVAHASRGFDSAGESRIARLPTDEARSLLVAGEFADGSMGPKIESAVAFTTASGHPALITTIGQVQRALAGEAGTEVVMSDAR